MSPKTIQYKMPYPSKVLFFLGVVLSDLQLRWRGVLGSTKKLESFDDVKEAFTLNSTKLSGRNIHLFTTLLSKTS